MGEGLGRAWGGGGRGKWFLVGNLLICVWPLKGTAGRRWVRNPGRSVEIHCSSSGLSPLFAACRYTCSAASLVEGDFCDVAKDPLWHHRWLKILFLKNGTSKKRKGKDGVETSGEVDSEHGCETVVLTNSCTSNSRWMLFSLLQSSLQVMNIDPFFDQSGPRHH